MKKTLTSLLLGFIILTFFVQKTFALTTPLTITVASPAAQKVEYNLPYPGILPDHPLYQLKMLRDKIMDLLITNPVKKIEFLILMADKRLGAGKALIDGNKPALGETTMAKGEDYFVRAIELAGKSKQEGEEVEGVLEKLNQSVKKHIEVLEELVVKAPDSIKSGLNNTLTKIKTQQEKILELKK